MSMLETFQAETHQEPIVLKLRAETIDGLSHRIRPSQFTAENYSCDGPTVRPAISTEEKIRFSLNRIDYVLHLSLSASFNHKSTEWRMRGETYLRREKDQHHDGKEPTEAARNYAWAILREIEEWAKDPKVKARIHAAAVADAARQDRERAEELREAAARWEERATAIEAHA